MKMVARPHCQGHGCCPPLDAQCSAAKKEGDKSESKSHPEPDRKKRERKMGGHKVTIKE